MERDVEEEVPLDSSPNIGGMMLFGCKWRVATDDFVFPAFFEVFTRVIGLIILVSVYFTEYDNAYIQHYGIDEYLIGHGVICFLVTINLTLLGLNSMQGNIWDERRTVRAFVAPLLYVNTVFVVVENILVIYGTHIMSRAWSNADSIDGADEVSTELEVTLLVIIISWFGMLSKFALTFIFFKKFRRGQTITKYVHHRFSTTHTFRVIGDTLSFFFHDADFVPTDTAAALFLLNLYKRNYSASEASTLNTENPKGFNYSDIEHYIKYASSIYGFFHLPLLKKMGSFMRVLGKGTCFCCHKDMLMVDSEGPCCSCFDMFAVYDELPFLDLDSFFFISFTNEISVTPYMVVVDKEKEKIVIAIRGSMSFNDAITDLLLKTTPIDGYENYYTHSGFMEAARRIYTELHDKEILDKALVMHPGYQIVVTGHSLGGSVAVVLTFLLRILYRSTTCYAFSTPICLNERARIESESFVVTVVYGDDVFPRLTPTNFALLVNQMRHVLRHSKVPKYKILGLKIFSFLFRRVMSLNDTLLHTSGSEDIFPQKMLINKYNRKHSTVLDLSLTLPGRILYVIKSNDDYCVREVPHTFFSKIEVSTGMTMDHLPINLLTSLEVIKHRSEV